MPKIKQFTSSTFCLKCDGCCRYHEKDSVWSVKDIPLRPNPNPQQSNFICSMLDAGNNKCKIYSRRPFECRLYPFLINRKEGKIFLAVDLNCPFTREKFNSREFSGYVEYLKGALKDTEKIAQGYPGVTDIFQLNEAPLRRISIKDKTIFDKYLKLSRHELSTYAFENIYIWKGLFDIYWMVIDKNLCVFFKDKGGIFLYLPPIGKSIKKETIEEVFNIMDRINSNKEISRIENVEEKDLPFYKELGYKCRQKPCDYICRRTDLSELRGNKFKAKRKGVNYFIKHYKFRYLPFSLKRKKNCILLYDKWAKNRYEKNRDSFYSAMLKDYKNALKISLDNYKNLGFRGKVIEMGGKIKAFTPLEKAGHKAPSFLTGFTFGFKLSKETFCILYEITDLSIKGLSQFIFQKFCSELKDYKYINIMDDSGLENLRRVKLSYRPARLAASYIIKKI